MKKASAKKVQLNRERLTALIVDDLALNRALAKVLLEVKQINVIEAENGQQALEYYSRYNPDIILMDICMPVMDGIESMIRIRENNKTSKKIPIIAFTSGEHKSSKMELMKKGFSEYIQKPFKEEDLIAKLGLFLPLKKENKRINLTA